MVPFVEWMDQQANTLASFSSISLYILCTWDKPDCLFPPHHVLYTFILLLCCPPRIIRTLFTCYFLIYAVSNHWTPSIILGVGEIKMVLDISTWISYGILNLTQPKQTINVHLYPNMVLLHSSYLRKWYHYQHLVFQAKTQNPSCSGKKKSGGRVLTPFLFLSNLLVLPPKYILNWQIYLQLDQCCQIQLSAMMEIFYIFSVQYNSH